MFRCGYFWHYNEPVGGAAGPGEKAYVAGFDIHRFFHAVAAASDSCR